MTTWGRPKEGEGYNICACGRRCFKDICAQCKLLAEKLAKRPMHMEGVDGGHLCGSQSFKKAETCCTNLPEIVTCKKCLRTLACQARGEFREIQTQDTRRRARIYYAKEA